jgi:hypothetical protein
MSGIQWKSNKLAFCIRLHSYAGKLELYSLITFDMIIGEASIEVFKILRVWKY